jgi:hypothetical protein
MFNVDFRYLVVKKKEDKMKEILKIKEWRITMR